MNPKYAVIVLCLCICLYFLFRKSEIRHGPGIMAPDAPVQTKYKGVMKTIKRGDYIITPVYDFKLKARALSVSRYYTDTESSLAKYDIAFGWGKMSDEQVLDNIRITQSGRFYYWFTKQFPIPRAEIETCSANMHLIAADPLVEKAIGRTIKGDIVELNGYLVSIKGKGNWEWISSFTRNDTGYGACEVIYVESFKIVTK